MFLGWFFTALTAPGLFDLAVLTVAGILPRPQREILRRQGSVPGLRLAVVIPAHNEEKMIRETLVSLQRCFFQKEQCQVVVVADNCSDGTANIAREHGARVFVRENHERLGKGYALDYAFKILIEENFDVFIVVDADTVVDHNFLEAMNQKFLEGAEAVQARYGVLDPGSSIRVRLMKVAFFAMNVLRPLGRESMDFSVGIMGNGFGLSRKCLEAVPYDAGSIVEDLEYHVKLVRAGKKVRFVDTASVRARMPGGGTGYQTQRARWEGGRLRLVFRQLPQLFVQICRGRWRLAEPFFDMLTLPLALQSLLLFLLCLIPGFSVFGVAGLVVVAVHVIAGIVVGRGTWKDFLVLFYAPVYMVWKMSLFPATLKASCGKAPWVRTNRDS